MRKMLVIAAALLAAQVSAADAPAPVGFRISGVEFSLPLPTGYCVPRGSQVDVAQNIAAADPQSVTHVTLVQCDVPIGTGANDYTLIKTPISALTMAVDRPQLLSSLGADFDKPETLKYLKSDAFDKGVSDNAGKVMPGNGTVRQTGQLVAAADESQITSAAA